MLAVKQLGDGGLHRRHKNDIELDIIQAFKPHSKAVRSISIDHSGDIMATGVRIRIHSNDRLVLVK